MMRVCILAGLLGIAPHALAQVREAPASKVDVLAGVEAIDAPVRTFLPKYELETFLAAGYTGTFSSIDRQWPTFALGLEALLLRPGRFDFGVYADWHVGRADASLGRYSSAFGLDAMWRAYESSFWDFALVVRGAYVLNWTHASRPLLRPGAGVQFSLLRFVALQLLGEGLFATSGRFSNDEHRVFGFSVTLKLGIAPFFEGWPQFADPPLPTIDRSLAVCEDATRTCASAKAPALRDALCAAAMRALDPAAHASSWDDPTGSFLDALRVEARPVLPALDLLIQDHRASVAGLDAYADKQRALSSSQLLNKQYSYLVTPLMIRDWLGCAADGRARRSSEDAKVILACSSQHDCELDTGVMSP